MNLSKGCYLVTSLVSVGLLIYGLLEILRIKPKQDEPTEVSVISRQIRGFGLLMLAQVLIIVGGALCFGLGGGVKALTGYVRKM